MSGSAQGPMLDIEYGKPLPFTPVLWRQTTHMIAKPLLQSAKHVLVKYFVILYAVFNVY